MGGRKPLLCCPGKWGRDKCTCGKKLLAQSGQAVKTERVKQKVGKEEVKPQKQSWLMQQLTCISARPKTAQTKII